MIDVLQEFFKFRIAGEGPVAASIRAKRYDLLVSLLRAGADPNEKQDYALSALSVAAGLGDVVAVSHLLRHGANANGARYEDSAPLKYAVEKEAYDVAALLLAHGASPQFLPTGQGLPAISFAKTDRMSELLARFMEDEE